MAEAERTLIRLLPLKDTTLYTFDSNKADQLPRSTRLVPTLVDEQSLDLKYRDVQLGRWSACVYKDPYDRTEAPKRDENSKGSQKKKTSGLGAALNRVFQTMKKLQKSEEDVPTKAEEYAPEGEYGYWSTRPEYKLSADFGQTLFPMEVANSKKASIAGISPVTQPVFAPSTPGLTSLLTTAHLHGSKTTVACFQARSLTESPSLLYDFVAAPDQQGFEAGQIFPKLHVQMRTSRTGGKAVLHKLSLGFREHVHDMLLPDHATDIRFARYGRLRLRKDHRLPDVEDWTKTVCENITSGERLTAPPLRIEVPNWTIPGQPAGATGMSYVTYLFSGVQFRQAVSGRFLDNFMSYSTVQSGKLGARGGSLSMYYDTVGQSTQTLYQNPYDLSAFITKVFTVVDQMTEAAAQSLPAFKIIRPRTEGSERKLRRSGAKAQVGEETKAKSGALVERDARRLAEISSAVSETTVAPDVESQESLEMGIDGAKDEQETEHQADASPIEHPTTDNTAESLVASETALTESEVSASESPVGNESSGEANATGNDEGTQEETTAKGQGLVGHSAAEDTMDPHMANALTTDDTKERSANTPTTDKRKDDDKTVGRDVSKA